MINIIFREIRQVKRENISFFFSVTGGIPVLTASGMMRGEWYGICEYLLLVFIAICSTFLPLEVPRTLYLCPLSLEQRKRYVKQGFWLKILVSNLIHFLVVTGYVILGKLASPFAAMIIIMFFFISIQIIILDFIMNYYYCSDLCKMGVIFIMLISIIFMFALFDGQRIGWNFPTVSGTIMIIFIAGYVVWLLRRFYCLMITTCSDYELSCQRRNPYRGRKVSRAR